MKTGAGPPVAVAAVGVAACAALLAACTTTPQPIPGAGEPSPEQSAAPSTPPAPDRSAGVAIPDGRIDAAVGKLDGIVRDVLDGTGVPAMAVAVVHGGRIAFAHGYGSRNPSPTDTAPAGADAAGADATGADTDSETDADVDANTVFPAGALSTSLSATVLATQLTGGLTWTTPVRQLLPDFTAADEYVSGKATLGDLYAGALSLPAGAGSAAARLGFDRQDIVSRIGALRAGPFRTRAAPTDLGPTIASEALAQSKGVDWAGLADRTLFTPLGMQSTSARSADDRAAARVRVDGRWLPAADREWTDAVAPAAGITTTARDMARWMRAVLAGGSHAGDQVIPSGPLTAALSPHAVASRPTAPDARAATRGYGFDIADSAAGRVVITARGGLAHSGGHTIGPDSALAMIPSAGVGIVTLTSAVSTPGHPVPAAETINSRFTDLVQFGSEHPGRSTRAAGPSSGAGGTGSASAAASDGGRERARAPLPAQPPPLPSYDGVYTNRFFGDATVRTANDETTLTLGPDGTTLQLTRVRGDTFAISPSGPDGPSAAVFRALHPGATAVFDGDSLTIDYLDQAGAFTR